MADVKIDMMLVDQGNSVKKKTGDVKELNGELTKSQKLARSAFSGSTGTAVPGQQMEDYNRGRGAIGTGAAGRDFANQAQGLGGLVRVYATFAANLFAVSAAFNALKNAADTTNLIKGLEQLGTASGVNLPKVAKDLEAASGGAVSLRDAMTATAQASSAGMSGENIKRMGDVARNASQALGVDMSNALDRLSRGITKLEPELLDEIGIFTRTEQASQDYARQLGKTVSSLTSFEKRQAFANAVLAEGEQKFSAIALETNPYNKLLASLKNVSQQGLELVNKVLGPITDFLSKSPMALAAVLALIATTLLKQAIPALTQWRTELEDNVERTSGLAQQNLELFRNYQQDISREVSKNISQTVRDQADLARDSWQTVGAELRKGALSGAADLKALLKRDLDSVTQDDLTRLDKRREQLERWAQRGTAGSPSQLAAQARLQEFQRIEPEIRKAIQSQLDYNKAIEAVTPRNLTIHGQLLQRIATDAENAEKKMRLLANAADNAAFSGPISAMRSMHGAIQRLAPSIGLASTAMLYLRGTVTVTAVAIGTLTTAMGNLLGTIGIIAGVGMLLSTVLSENADEAAKASQSLDALKSSGDNLDRVLESISKKTPLEKLSAENLSATGTAMADLTDSINKYIKDLDASVAARGWFDSFTNWLSIGLGKSDEQVLARSLSKQLEKILKAASTSIDAADIRKDLISSLGLEQDASDKTIISSFIENYKTSGQELDRIVNKFANSARGSKAFSDNLKELTKTFTDLKNEIIPKGKLIDSISQSTAAFSDLIKMFDGPATTSLANMNSLLNNTQALSILPENARAELIAISPVIDDLSNKMAANQQAISNSSVALMEYQKELADLALREEKIKEQGKTPGLAIAKRKSEVESQANIIKDAIRDANRAITKDSNVIEGYKETFKRALSYGIDANAKVLETLFATSITKARIQTEQTALSKLPQTEAVIDRQSELQKRQLDLDAKSQVVQNRLVIANEKTANELALLRNELAINRANEIQRLAMSGVSLTPQQIEQFSASGGELYRLGQERAEMLSKGKALDLIAQGRGTQKAIAATGVNPQEAQSLRMLSQGMTAPLQIAAEGKKLIDLENNLAKINLGFSRASFTLNSRIADIDIDLQRLENLPEGLRQSSLDIIQALKQEKIDLTTQLQGLEPQRAGALATEAAGFTQLTQAQRQGAVAEATKGLDLINRQGAAQKNIVSVQEQQRQELERINNLYELQSIELKSQEDLRSLTSSALQDSLNHEQQLLDIQKQRSQISADEYNKKSREISLRRIELDYENQIKNIRAERDRRSLDLAKKYEQAGGTDGIFMDSDTGERLKRESESMGAWYAAALKSAADAKNRALELDGAMEFLTDRQLAYADVFKSTFDKMADAIVQFAQTGKLNFKDLINSMLADLLRYELRLQMMAMYQSMRPGLMNLIPSLFGASGFSGSSIGFGIPSGAAMAMGGAFDDGVRKYAKGGTFTNSIVSQPTLFRFAKGTGMMGEAGPEAIMPLKRDSSGNLGVRGGGGSVEVVVNNYTTAPAEARETTDSRGNRRIEVVVGDMTAGEVTRGGSSTSRAITNTFGMKPQLIRR
jgi:lambda family phage tail tape measure protein